MLRSGKRRLQRGPDFTGKRLSSFGEVFVRHGLPGLTLALAFLAMPSLRPAFVESVSAASSRWAAYTLAFLIILVALNGYVWFTDRQWRVSRLGWVLYLGALSVWEEWVFRLGIPQILEAAGASVWLAATMSALIFGGVHYFTLRWKWQWCFSAFAGGLYFSYQMDLHGDLILVAAIHWIATTINTPRPPRPSASDQTDD